MKTIEGKSNIKATVICDSISEAGIELPSFEIEYPRIIHAELMTHRVLSRNAASSRAIPFAKMVDTLNGIPVRFGANVSGMQDDGQNYDSDVLIAVPDKGLVPMSPTAAWEYAKDQAVNLSASFAHSGYHKQVFNRLTEPFQMMKTVISGTEWDNFFWLRDDGAADPTLAELARCMREAKDASTPQLLKAGEWHLPYIDVVRNSSTGELEYGDISELIMGRDQYFTKYALEDAIKISCARCAAVSYRNEGYTLEKCRELYERLVGSDKKHSSALEHCGTPMAAEGEYFSHKEDWFGLAVYKPKNYPFVPDSWQEGISHVDRQGQLWSGNIRGWIQHRKLIPGENYQAT